MPHILSGLWLVIGIGISLSSIEEIYDPLESGTLVSIMTVDYTAVRLRSVLARKKREPLFSGYWLCCLHVLLYQHDVSRVMILILIFSRENLPYIIVSMPFVAVVTAYIICSLVIHSRQKAGSGRRPCLRNRRDDNMYIPLNLKLL